MALLEGRTAVKLADLTVHSDGRIDSGLAMNGDTYHGVQVRRCVLKHHDVRRSDGRISIFHVGPIPTWWGSTHATALKEWMARFEIPLRVAAMRSTMGNRIDVSDKRHSDAVPEINS